MKYFITIFLLFQSLGYQKLNDYDREHLLKSDSFKIISDVNDLPSNVRNSFKVLIQDSIFAMANPGEEYQVTDVVENDNLPLRRLFFAGISTDHCFIHYEMGGIGHAYYIVLFRLKNKSAIFVWGATAWNGYHSLDSLRIAIVNKKFKDDLPYLW
jgi:hypothetical protein